jgi:hypothetical protein
LFNWSFNFRLLFLFLFFSRLLVDLVFVLYASRFTDPVIVPRACVRRHAQRVLFSASTGAVATKEDRQFV